MNDKILLTYPLVFLIVLGHGSTRGMLKKDTLEDTEDYEKWFKRWRSYDEINTIESINLAGQVRLIREIERRLENNEGKGIEGLLEEAACLYPCGDFNGFAGVLNRAAALGCHCLLRLLLTRKDIDPNDANRGWCTPLMRAAMEGNLTCLKLLLDDPRIEVNEEMENLMGEEPTALMKAVSIGFVAGVRALLEHPKINVHVKDENGNTALNIARQKLDENMQNKKNDDNKKKFIKSLKSKEEKIKVYKECIALLESRFHYGDSY